MRIKDDQISLMLACVAVAISLMGLVSMMNDKPSAQVITDAEDRGNRAGYDDGFKAGERFGCFGNFNKLVDETKK